MPEPLLSASGVCASYGSMQVLWDVGIEVRSGENVVLLGANGAGKTTLLRALLGLVAMPAGTIVFDGVPIQELRTDQRIRLGIGYMSESAVFAELTVEENLLLGGWPVGRRRARARAAELYDTMPELAGRRRTRAGSLSGGQRKMVGIAKALVSEPRLVVMDEPSSGLSPLFVSQVVATVARLASSGAAFLVAEQNVAFLGAAQRVYVLEGGRVRFGGTVGDLEADTAMHEAFFGLN